MEGSWLYSRVGDLGAPRFHLFISDVDQRNKEGGWVQDYLAWQER